MANAVGQLREVAKNLSGKLVQQLGCYWASTVGVEEQALLLGLCMTHNHRARVGPSVAHQLGQRPV
jgi:hypothetical protein